MVLLETLLSNFTHAFAGMSPAATEIIKIIVVSVGWPGALAFFMWKRDKMKQKQSATHEQFQVEKAA